RSSGSSPRISLWTTPRSGVGFEPDGVAERQAGQFGRQPLACRGSVRAPAAGLQAGGGALDGGQVEEVRRLVAGRRLQRLRGVLHDFGAGGGGAQAVAED